MAYTEITRRADARYYRKHLNDPVRRFQWRVRSRTRRAVKDGRLIRGPCEVCGAAAVDAHHDDYGRPLDVRWLCMQHHKQWHKANVALMPAVLPEVEARSTDFSARLRQKTTLRSHCKEGHALSGVNVYVSPRGIAECRECRRGAHRRWLQKQEQPA